MAKEIKLSANARTDFNAIAKYLSLEFGGRVSEQFMHRFDEMCSMISQNPFIYQICNEKRQVRKAAMRKQCIIYYKVNAGEVEVLRIFDTRQNPDKLKNIL